MPNKTSDHFIAIETAIGGGSIALFDGAAIIDDITGTTGTSRAEDVLPNILTLLQRNNIAATEMKQIVVGAGPGSFTGIRIGIATATGLSVSLGIPMRLISTLGAIAVRFDNERVVALSIGRDSICIQAFPRRDGGIHSDPVPEVLSLKGFIGKLEESPSRNFAVNRTIFDSIPDNLRSNMFNCGDNIAGYIGRAAHEGNGMDVAEPLFIGKRN